MIRLFVLAAFVSAGVLAKAQDVPLEYQVKAAYLFNFTKFVEWPPDARVPNEPLKICIAERNPFGPVLASTLAVGSSPEQPLAAQVVRDAAMPCHVLFVPRGIRARPYLNGAVMHPTLTVGESPDFLEEGGIIRFVLEGGRVHFEISREAAARNRLMLSARLLKLARLPEQESR